MNSMQRSAIEIKCVTHLLAVAKTHGWSCEFIHTGDGWERVAEDEVMDAAFSVEYAELRFTKYECRAQWVQLIFGNDGWDVIADHTFGEPSWDAAMEEVHNQIEIWEEAA